MKLEYSISSIQYNVSLASFEEMDILAMKSFFDWPANASQILAPIEVEERRNCFDSTNRWIVWQKPMT